MKRSRPRSKTRPRSSVLGPRFFLLLLFLVASVVSASTIKEQMGEVEKIRGLKFKGEVTTIEIDRSDLPSHLRKQFEKTLPYSIAEYGDILRALRLIPATETDDAVVSSLIDLYQQQVLAYYDPPSKTFYTVKQLPEALASMPMSGMMAEGVNIHELTHALQDQYFQIGQRDLALRDDADGQLAYHALIEGEASLVMLAYMVGQAGGSLDDLIGNDTLGSALNSAAAMTLPSDGPKYFTEMLKFPYLDGLHFVIEAYKRGGWAEFDRIYANPPLSTREILHPADYFEHRFKRGTFAATPSIPVAQFLSVEHLGEFHWRFLTGVGDGWKNDRVTIAQNRFCEPTVLVETQWETAAQARAFYDAYTKSLDDIGSLSRLTGTTVRVAYGADRALMERFVAP